MGRCEAPRVFPSTCSGHATFTNTCMVALGRGDVPYERGTPVQTSMSPPTPVNRTREPLQCIPCMRTCSRQHTLDLPAICTDPRPPHPNTYFSLNILNTSSYTFSTGPTYRVTRGGSPQILPRNPNLARKTTRHSSDFPCSSDSPCSGCCLVYGSGFRV